MRFAILHSICLKYRALHRKARLAVKQKNTLANLKIQCSRKQSLSCNQRADLLTYLVQHLLYCTCHAKVIFADPLPRKSPGLPTCLETATKPSRFDYFHTWQNPWRLRRKKMLQSLKNCQRHAVFLACGIWTWKWASRHNSINFQKCSKNGVSCTFILHNLHCPTIGRALLEHLNFQKCSENYVLCVRTKF